MYENQGCGVWVMESELFLGGVWVAEKGPTPEFNI
jgi:hypothetical protein